MAEHDDDLPWLRRRSDRSAVAEHDYDFYGPGPIDTDPRGFARSMITYEAAERIFDSLTVAPGWTREDPDIPDAPGRFERDPEGWKWAQITTLQTILWATRGRGDALSQKKRKRGRPRLV